MTNLPYAADLSLKLGSSAGQSAPTERDAGILEKRQWTKQEGLRLVVAAHPESA